MEGLPVTRTLRLRHLVPPVGVNATGLVLLVACAGLSACGPTELQGSLTELLDLHYESVEVSQSGQEIAVRFLTPQGSGQNLVMEFAADVSGLTLKPGVAIDLSEQAPDGQQRGKLSRDVLNDPRRTFPSLFTGKLTLDALPKKSGQPISGKVSATFEECIQFACGRTIFGDFAGKVP